MQPTALQVAEDLFKVHKKIDGKTVYEEQDVIEILVRYDIPEPDFDSYSKIANNKSTRAARNRKKKNALSAKINAIMEQKKITPKIMAKMANKSLPTVYRWIGATNLQLDTIFEIEKVLGVQLVNI